jgi:predicted component of type VI protein secretion system
MSVSTEAPPAALTWHRGDALPVTFPLTSERTLVGRDEDAPVRLEEPLVSRAHAEIVRTAEGYVVRDLGSTNLTRVNDQIVSECLLADGDELRFARARCTFHCGQAVTSEGPPRTAGPS